jgi:hypothetical protein
LTRRSVLNAALLRGFGSKWPESLTGHKPCRKLQFQKRINRKASSWRARVMIRNIVAMVRILHQTKVESVLPLQIVNEAMRSEKSGLERQQARGGKAKISLFKEMYSLIYTT